ncbi:hypothetical protein GCM10010205_69150 [Streptomyces nojiriensis]|nr:hypothetical protein GCM10010205_69150 [Streptomyces nojiriensis]
MHQVHRCLSKWYTRWRAHGENGLRDHASRSATRPSLSDLVGRARGVRCRRWQGGGARCVLDVLGCPETAARCGAGRSGPDKIRKRRHSPARTPEGIADLVEALRRQTKHGPAGLAADLQRLHSVTLAPATVHRILVRRGLNRLRDLDPPTGE